MDAISTLPPQATTNQRQTILNEGKRFFNRSSVIGRRGLEKLDLLMLIIESLDLNGGEAMLWTSNSLGYEKFFTRNNNLFKHTNQNALDIFFIYKK